MKVLTCSFFSALQRTLDFSGFRIGGVNRARRVVNSVGGKAANSARVLARFGVDHLLFGFAGGYIGGYIRRLLDDENISYRLVETVSESRICQTILDENAYDFTEVVEDAELPSGHEFDELLHVFGKIEAGFDFVIFSGTLPPGAPVDIYARLLALTNPEKVLLDTSGEALLAALPERPAMVKINGEELERTLAISGSPDELARELVNMGAGYAGITRGAESALLADRSGVRFFDIPSIDVVSTLGCGDSVNAGVCIGLGRGYSMAESFAYGLACGLANALESLPGEVDPLIADKFFDEVACEE